MNFFIDTASPEAISSIWDQIQSDNLENHVAGVTTNPKALAKYFKQEFGLSDLKTLLIEINDVLVNKIQAPDPIIYIQVPSDVIQSGSVKTMVNFASGLPFNVGIKIPHYQWFLTEVSNYPNVSFNVTGVADYLIAAKVLSYNVDYVSIIPGRMEEAGMDYVSGLSLLSQVNGFKNRVIAGSMRTLEQLDKTLQYGCVPTIGETAFNNILPELKQKNLKFASVLLPKTPEYYSFDSGNKIGTELSRGFFDEMNRVNLLKV